MSFAQLLQTGVASAATASAVASAYGTPLPPYQNSASCEHCSGPQPGAEGVAALLRMPPADEEGGSISDWGPQTWAAPRWLEQRPGTASASAGARRR